MKISLIFIIFTLLVSTGYIIWYVLNHKKLKNKTKSTKFVLKYVLLMFACCTIGAWWIYIAFIEPGFIVLKLMLILIFLIGLLFFCSEKSFLSFNKILGILIMLVVLFFYFICNMLELKKEPISLKKYELELVQDSSFENTGDIIIQFESKDKKNIEYAIMKYDKNKLEEFNLPKDFKLPLHLNVDKNTCTDDSKSTIVICVKKEQIVTINTIFELVKPKTTTDISYILDISKDNIKIH